MIQPRDASHLATAQGRSHFPRPVERSVMGFDMKFFLRVAARADTAPAQEKNSLSARAVNSSCFLLRLQSHSDDGLSVVTPQALANRTMKCVDMIVRKTKTQIASSQEVRSLCDAAR